MPDQKPILRSAEDIYNFLMAHIEPELCTSHLGSLKEKYKNETPEEKQARGERYKKAFVEYDTQAKEFFMQLQDSATKNRRTALATAEQESKAKEDSMLSTLESQMFS